MKGLYVHIPFCDHICSYCDFLKLVSKEPLKKQYIDALINEIDLKIESKSMTNIDTIYIGGGTPSCLPLFLLEKLLIKLDEIFKTNKIKEYTIEANPIDITKDFLELIKNHNINRLSLGIQSFHNKKLELLNRNHTRKIAIDSIELSKQYIKNISIDLIYGFSLDTFSYIKKDIEKAIELGVNHISAYSLILEDRTLLKHLYDKGEFSLMDEDKEAKLYYKIASFLENNNYNHYEISNFALKGYESIHNQIYWNNELYEAVGIGASSYIKINNEYHRLKNITKISDYNRLMLDDERNINNIIQEDDLLNINDIMEEEIMLGLRLMRGINKNNFKNKFNTDIKDAYPHINNLIKNNLLIENEEYIYINKNKLYISDSIILFIYN